MCSRRVILAGFIILFTLLAAPPARAGWVWSPQTGWIGPSGAVKDTPAEQLLFAQGLFDQHKYDKARLEFKKLVRAFPKSPEASEGQYYLGRCEEETGDYYKAFKEYRKTVQVYPSTGRFEEVLEREYQIGNYFLAGKRRKILGIAALLPARDKAAEIFEAIVEDGPFSEHGQLAQYKLGLAHLGLRDYEQAVTAFEQVISRYPDSPLVDDARFQIAQASLKGVFRAGFDQSATELAMRELESFLREYPSSDLGAEVLARLEELKEQRAEHEFQVGQFYERRRHPGSAVIHYRGIVQQYQDTMWAPKASARIASLQPRLP